MNLRIWKDAAALPVLGTLAAMLAIPAAAQTAPATDPTKKDEPQKLESFVVTGSYIPTNETAFSAGVSPVVKIDRKVIDQSGLTSTAELLQKITVSNGGSVPISNNATGFTPAATSVSLRGLGPGETLVLINGRRVATYPVGDGGTTAFVDLNSIALDAVDSIEVLKDGASAIYGADAVAGVVNIKMRRSMDGTEVSVRYGNTTNKDSSEFTASVLTGAQTDKASAMVGFNYYKKNAIMNRDRDYSAVPPFLSSNSSPLNLQVSRFAVNAALGQTQGANVTGTSATQAYGVGNATGPENIFFAASPLNSSNNGAVAPSGYTYSDGRSSAFNFNEFSMSYPKRDNRGMFAYAERKIFGTDNLKAYVDTSYQNAATENQLAPSATGDFNTAGQTTLIIPAKTANPILTVINNTTHAMTQVAAGSAAPANSSPGPGTQFVGGAVQRLAAAGAFNQFNPYNQDISGGTRARLAEFGNRIFRNNTDAILLTAGLKGENIAGKWNFDTYYSYSAVKDTSRNTLDSASRFNRAVNGNDSFFQQGSSDYVGTTQPYNPFGYYKVPIANNSTVIPAVLITTKDRNESLLNSFSAVLSTGDLIDLPAGPVGFALGADARHEQLNQYPDPFGQTGDLIGSSTSAITQGQRKVWGIFGEWGIPILRDVPGAHSLNASLAVRHEDFVTNNESTTVPKLGLRWQPIDDTLTLRASWSKGFKEPSLFQMYSSPTAGLVNITNPISKVFEPEQPVTVSGNRRLAPEKSEFTNAGFVWSPSFKALHGLTLGVDYWEAKITGAVANDYQSTVNRFFGKDASGATASGGLLPGESVIVNPDGSINVVNSVFFNVGITKAAGFDYSGSYVFKTDNAGRFDLSTVWTMYTHLRQANTAGDPLQELINQPVATGTGSDDGYLRWKGRAEIAWAYKGYNASFTGNFTDGFWDLDLDGNPFFVKTTWIFDAQIGYNFHNELGRWLADTKFTVGARNVFDRDPPYAAGFGGNSTGYPSFLYSSEGRFWYAAITRKF